MILSAKMPLQTFIELVLKYRVSCPEVVKLI